MTTKGTGRTVALLLSGGGGRRLWPASTDDAPKQFLRLFDDRSLFQKTLARLATADIADIVIVANTRHEALVRRQTAETGAAAALLLLEPMRRDPKPSEWICGGAISRKAQSRHGRALSRERRLFLEQRHVRLSRRRVRARGEHPHARHFNRGNERGSPWPRRRGPHRARRTRV